MSNVTPISTPSVREQAEAELRAENAKQALAGMKQLLKRRQAAAVVLANIDREIADYEEAIAQGNLPA